MWKSIIIAAFALLVFAQANNASAAARYVIKDNSTGGDCSRIGVWDSSTKTCTLTRNFYNVGPWIGGYVLRIASSGITLDGNGHFISAAKYTLGACIWAYSVSGITIKNMELDRCYRGIRLDNVSGGSIHDNTISRHPNKPGHGIRAYNSSNLLITDNYIHNGGGGISVRGGADNVIANNIVDSNLYSGIGASSSARVIVEYNTITRNGSAGIGLTGNYVYGNIRYNDISENKYGIYFHRAFRYEIYGNNIANNNWELWQHITGYNNIYNNNFYANGQPGYFYKAYDIYNLSAPVGGNYWNDFDSPEEGCFDTNNDGFCDDIYYLDATHKDRLPLTSPFEFGNEAPVADAGADQTAECSGPAGSSITLDGSGSTDPDGDALTYTWSGSFGSATGETAAVALPLGTYTITLTVDDGNGGIATDDVVVTVADTTAPDVSATLSGALLTNGWYLGDVLVEISATDTCSGVDRITYTLDGALTVASGSYASETVTSTGTHTGLYSATDNEGNSSAEASLSMELFTADSDGLVALISKLVSEGSIAPQMENSLVKQAGNGSYKALVNHIEAQTGKKIDPEASALLLEAIGNITDN